MPKARGRVNKKKKGKIVLGISAMEKKAKCKPMSYFLERINALGDFEVVIFDEETILNQEPENWPKCEVLFSWYSYRYPIENILPIFSRQTCRSIILKRADLNHTFNQMQKAIKYAEIVKPSLINDLVSQYELLDRRKVYKKLQEHGVPVPDHIIINRDLDETGQLRDPAGFIEDSEFVELDGKRIYKPFVEKPFSGEDHNIFIYYPTKMGGGVKKLYRKIGDKSGDYVRNHSGRVRKDSSFIYEEFLSTAGTDVKVYTVGPHYAHAEGRKSPVVDGKVNRLANGKEQRTPLTLNQFEKDVANKIVRIFKQNVCGFDLLRGDNRKSYVCDVNGWSFVKNSSKYYDDAAQLLRNYIFQSVRYKIPQPLPPFLRKEYAPMVRAQSVCALQNEELDEEKHSLQRSQNEELRCVIAVVRHGDRTPKQKFKVNVEQEQKQIFSLYEKYKNSKKKEAKLKSPQELGELLTIVRSTLIQLQTQIAKQQIKREDSTPYTQELKDHIAQVNQAAQILQQNQPKRPSQESQYSQESSNYKVNQDGQVNSETQNEFLIKQCASEDQSRKQSFDTQSINQTQSEQDSQRYPQAVENDTLGQLMTTKKDNCRQSIEESYQKMNSLEQNSSSDNQTKQFAQPSQDNSFQTEHYSPIEPSNSQPQARFDESLLQNEAFQNLDPKKLLDLEDKYSVAENILGAGGKFEGVNRKAQLKATKFDPKTGQATQLQFILKHGGMLTHAGRAQSEHLGKVFRQVMYPSNDADGKGLLRLHFTYRHDLKVTSSDEGRVQTSAAAFAKQFLSLEGSSLTPILVSLISHNSHILENQDDSVNYDKSHVKEYLHNHLTLNRQEQQQQQQQQQFEQYRAPIHHQQSNHTQNNNGRDSNKGQYNIYQTQNTFRRTRSSAEDQALVPTFRNLSLQRNLKKGNYFDQIVTKFPENPLDKLHKIKNLMNVLVECLREKCQQHQKQILSSSFNNTQERDTFNVLHNNPKTLKIDNTKPCQNEPYILIFNRWSKLLSAFYKKGSFDISKIPDIYDSSKYDVLHNGQLGLPLEDLYHQSKRLADVVITSEYGITTSQKLNIGCKIGYLLISKLLKDLQLIYIKSLEEIQIDREDGLSLQKTMTNMSYNLETSQEDDNNEYEDSADEEPRHSIHPEAANVKSPSRHVRTRIYFTSESHIHALVNIIRWCHVIRAQDTGSNGGQADSRNDDIDLLLDTDGKKLIDQTSEYDYLTQIIFKMYEDISKDINDPSRFRIEIWFSPGAAQNPYTLEQNDNHVIYPLPRLKLTGGQGVDYKTFKDLLDPFQNPNVIWNLLQEINLDLI